MAHPKNYASKTEKIERERKTNLHAKQSLSEILTGSDLTCLLAIDTYNVTKGKKRLMTKFPSGSQITTTE